jgi:hypothetical protein
MMFGIGKALLAVRISHLLPMGLIALLAISAIYAISVLNVFWMFIAIAALVASLVPALRGGTMFGAWKLWVPVVISGPYILAFISYAFGFEPFDLKSPIFWVIGSTSIFALSLVMMDVLALTKVRLNTSFTVVFAFVLYEALLAVQGPVDLYINGHIGSSYFEDNMVMMGYLIICTVIGLLLTAAVRWKLGLITLFQMPGKGEWAIRSRSSLSTTIVFTVALICLTIASLMTHNRYSMWTGIISLLLLWVPQGLELRGMIRLPRFVFVIIGVSLVLNSLGVVSGLYDNTFWWDKITHIMSGFAVAAIATVALLILQGLHKISIPHYWYIFFIFIIVMFFEATWEIIEFTLDSTIGTTMQHGKLDTVNDLLSDSFSGVIAGIAAAYYAHNVDPYEYIEHCEAEKVVQIFDGSL